MGQRRLSTRGPEDRDWPAAQTQPQGIAPRSRSAGGRLAAERPSGSAAGPAARPASQYGQIREQKRGGRSEQYANGSEQSALDEHPVPSFWLQ